MPTPHSSRATIVVLGRFNDGHEAVFAHYSSRIRTFLARFDARVVRRQRIDRTLYGSHFPDLFMVIDFNDRADAAEAFFSPEYLELIPLRDQVFSSFNMFLSGHGEL